MSYLQGVERKKGKSPIDTAAATMRSIALDAAEGTLLGSEDELVGLLGVSRVTMRQAARLLEREGVLRVRRGINGGYFASRPSSEMVESVVCAYLDTLGLDGRHTGSITTALWAQVLREASAADAADRLPLVEQLTKAVEGIPSDAGIEIVGRVEVDIRSQIFRLIDGAYIELMFRINGAFARSHLENKTERLQPEAHIDFVGNWKRAKLMELNAIASGDPMLAMMAALHERSLWMKRSNYPLRDATG